VGAEWHRFWLDGLDHVLKGDVCEGTEDGCGRASAKGWLVARSCCCEQVRWREAGSCIALRSPQQRSLVICVSSRAPTTLKAAFPVVNAETPTQLCRDFVPQAQSRSQLGAVELFASTWVGTILSSPTASVERTPTTIHIARRHISLGVLGRDSSCSRRNCNRVALASLSPSPSDCDQKGAADEHCEL
jgi:hypothetical protein